MRAAIAKTVGIVLGLSLGAAALWLLWSSLRPVSESRRLADGSVVSVEWVSYGRTNVFVDGSTLQRTFGSWAQKTKIKALASIKPPVRDVSSDPEGILSFRLCFKNVDRRSSPFFLDSWKRPRIIISDADTGHRYLGRIWDLKKSRNGRDWHAYMGMTAFPRAQKYLKLDIQDEHGDSLGELSVKNPAYAAREPSAPAPSPPTITVGDLEVIFGAMEFPEKAPPGTFGGLPMAILNVKITQQGAAVTNWRATDTRLRDLYGNHQFMNAGKSVSNDWQQYHLYGFLDPANAWKTQFSITRDADFTPEELCTFDVSFPLPVQKIEDCHGHRLQVGFVNTDMLAVDLLDTNANVRLTFIGAADERGRLESGSGNWGQHRFWRALDTRRVGNMLNMESPKPGTIFRVTVAIHTNYPVEHIFAPPKPAAKRQR